ncbi:MAG: hypothetical protein C5S47_01465 [Candidatus Methanogasteraceae archaeon]|nr:MAG: hypothetical protein C5S47_01465 [ANME-2 cluster archaeon]
MHPMMCHGKIKRAVHGRGTETQSFAVNRYQMGERPSKICESVGRSRVWLRKWIRRYDNSDKNSKKEWFRDESRAPKTVHRKTDLEMERLVIKVRKSLMKGTTGDTRYRCIGAVEIQSNMHELGQSEDEMPSLSTIKRIIKRSGPVVQKKKRYIRCRSKKRYTLLNPTKANEVHQMDNAWTATHQRIEKEKKNPGQT